MTKSRPQRNTGKKTREAWIIPGMSVCMCPFAERNYFYTHVLLILISVSGDICCHSPCWVYQHTLHCQWLLWQWETLEVSVAAPKSSLSWRQQPESILWWKLHNSVPHRCLGPKLMVRQRQRCFSFGTGCAGPGPPRLQRGRNLSHEPAAQQGSLGKEGQSIWGRTETLMKPLCWGSKECLGKQDVESQLLPSASTGKWSQRRRAGSVMWQLKKEQWRVLCSSLFLHFLRQSFRLGKRKKNVLSRKKKTDLPLPSGERLYLRAKVCLVLKT